MSPNSSTCFTILLCAFLVTTFTACASLEKGSVSENGASIRAAHEVALDMQWRSELVGWEPFGWASLEFSQPAVCCDGQHVVVGTSNGMVSVVSLLTGAVTWTFDTGASVNARPAVSPDNDKLIVVGNSAAKVYALDIDEGLKWMVQLNGEVEDAVISNGSVFFMTSDEVLHAYDLERGEQLWAYSRPVPDDFMLNGLSMPLVHEDLVYTGFADGKMVALEASSGQVVWSRDLSNGETRFVDVDADPVIDPRTGLLYTASYSGGVFALNPKSGEVVWRADLTGATTLAMSPEMLYTTTSGRYVVAISPETGEVRWQIRHKKTIPTAAAVIDDYLFYGDTENGLMVLDRLRGLPIVKYDTKSGFSAKVTALARKKRDTLTPYVVVLSNGGVLYNFELTLAP